METSVVIQLYEKSIEKHSLFYDPFIGDGGSLAFRELSELMYMASKIKRKRRSYWTCYRKNQFTMTKPM